jgi:hypothetical protein
MARKFTPDSLADRDLAEIASGGTAIIRLHNHETFADWLDISRALAHMQQAA